MYLFGTDERKEDRTGIPYDLLSERLRGHRRQGPIWTSVRRVGVKAVSAAQRGAGAERGRIDAGEHRRTLLARRCRRAEGGQLVT